MCCWHPGVLEVAQGCREPVRLGMLVDSQGAGELQGWGLWGLPGVLGTYSGWVCCGFPEWWNPQG